MSLFSGKKYTVYNVEGRDSSGNHNEVQKRYNEFLDLRRRLIEIQPAIAEIPFPKKTLFASKDSDARKDRRRILFGAFLQRALLDKVCRAETERWLGDAGHEGAKVFIGSSAIRRAHIDRRSEFVAHNDFRRIFELMKIPTPMLKFSGRGEPHWRFFALSDDMTELRYEGSRKAGGEGTPLKIQSLQEVLLGQGAFKQNRARAHLAPVSFSIIGRDRQMHLVCRHPHELRIWYIGLLELKRQKLGNDGKYNGRGSWFGTASPMLRKSSYDSDNGSDLSDSEEGCRRNLDIINRTMSQLGKEKPLPSIGEEDYVEADDGDRYIWVTSRTTTYTWGSNSWGQLGQTSVPGPPESSAKSFPKATLLHVPDEGTSSHYEPPSYVSNIACGGDCTVFVNGFCRNKVTFGTNGEVWDKDMDLRLSESETPKVVRDSPAWCAGRAVVASPALHSEHSVLRNISHTFKPLPMIGVPDNREVVMAACGDSHLLVLLSDGSIYSCGSNLYGQLGNGTNNEGFKLKPVKRFGLELGEKTRAVSIAAGSTFSAAIVEIEVPMWREGSSFDIDDEDSVGDSDDDNDEDHSYKRLLFSWGDGTYGVLGHGDEECRNEPSVVDTFNYKHVEQVRRYQNEGNENDTKNSFSLNARLRALRRGAILQQISCGEMHMALLVQDSPFDMNATRSKLFSSMVMNEIPKHTIWTWGLGVVGQLGHGDTDNKLLPQPVEALAQKSIRQISCGATHTVAIVNVESHNLSQVSRGRVAFWGANFPHKESSKSVPAPKLLPEYLNFTKSNKKSNVAEQVACGDHFTAILDEDGKITVIGLSPTTNKPVVVSSGNLLQFIF